MHVLGRFIGEVGRSGMVEHLCEADLSSMVSQCPAKALVEGLTGKSAAPRTEPRRCGCG